MWVLKYSPYAPEFFFHVVFSFLENNSLKRPDFNWLEGIQISLTTVM